MSHSPRVVRCGLIQCSNPINDEARPVAEIQKAMLEKHEPMIEDAGRKGVQILCLQEIFNGPYFCPSQDVRWYDAAEPVPGPTTEHIASLAKKHRMAVVVPVYEREMSGVLYNTAAVYRRRRDVSRQVPQAPHSAGESGLLREVLLQARDRRLPRLQDPLRDDRRLHLLRPPLPRRRPLPRARRRGDRLQSLGDRRGSLAVHLEDRAAGSRGRQRLLHGLHQPRRHRSSPGTSGSSTGRATSPTRVARSWSRRARIATSSWSRISISR